MRKDHLLQIDLCCLDDNGGFNSTVTAIEFHIWRDRWDQLIQFEHEYYPSVEDGAPVAFFAHQAPTACVSPWNNAARFCQIADHWLPLRTVPAAGGNIYWITFCTDIEAGAELLLHLLKQKPVWDWSDAECWLINAFEQGPLDLPKLLNLLSTEN